MPHCHTYLQALRGFGYRITPQREMIIEAFVHYPQHVTAEEIYEQVRQRTRAVNIATVYRTLDLLVEKGLANRAGLQDGRMVYATAHHGPHLHLVCRACGRVIDADNGLFSALDAQLREYYHFAADLGHVTILGLCTDCQSQVIGVAST
jgi:Fur family transcriptional regulator, ferric uptake regulator